jgi:NDP-sugar pyrophosphorylase family protein
MLNIVIPMAGRGSRFAKAGYEKPKPLIDIKGKPMIQVVVENLRPDEPHRFIFICQQEHVKVYGLTDLLHDFAPGSEIVEIDGITEGAACTVLKAKPFINDDNPIMIANSDQYVDININDYLAEVNFRNLDGLIMTMKADDEKWSFARVDEKGYVTEVKEKVVISSDATVGIYNFSLGAKFVEHAEAMFENKEMQNGEYYVAPVYNRFIAAGLKIGIYDIGREANGMYGLGTPADLDLFLSLPVSAKI